MDKKTEKYKKKISNRATLLLIINIIECIALIVVAGYILVLAIRFFLPPSENSESLEKGLHIMLIIFLGIPMALVCIFSAFAIPTLVTHIDIMINTWREKYKDDYIREVVLSNNLIFLTEVIPTIFLFSRNKPKLFTIFGILIGIRLVTSVLILRIKVLKNKIKEIDKDNIVLEIKDESEQNNIDDNKTEEEIDKENKNE